MTEGHVATSRGRRGSGYVIGTCAAVQIIALVAIARADVVAGATATVIGVAVGLWLYRRWVDDGSFARDVMLVSGSIGGLAMLVGGAIDSRTLDTMAAPGHAHGAHAHHLVHVGVRVFDVSILATWMGALMLATCIPACALWCRHPCADSRWRAWTGHALCTVGMIAGMLMGGALVSGVSHAALAPVIHHLAMLTGMVAGSGAVAAGDDLLRPALRPEATA